MNKNLFVRPKHDDVTSYLYYYSRELIEESSARGFITLNKEQQDAKKEIIANVILKNNPKFIMFNGHGNTTIIC